MPNRKGESGLGAVDQAQHGLTARAGSWGTLVLHLSSNREAGASSTGKQNGKGKRNEKTTS